MKKWLLFMATIGSVLGSYLPTLFGDTSFLDGWSLLGGFVGGMFGIWAGVKLAKRYS